jgi:hypothetical protein
MRARAIVVAAALLAEGALAGEFGLDAAAFIGGSVPVTATHNDPYLNLGLGVKAIYQIPRWAFGFMTRAFGSTSAPFYLRVDGFEAEGDLVRRQASIGPMIQYRFAKSPVWIPSFLEFGVLAVQSEFVQASKVFDFEQEEGEERLFIRGFGMTLGAGVQMQQSPVFFQLSYEYQRFEYAQVVGVQKMLNYVVTERRLRGDITSHSLFLAIGIADVL